MQYISKINFSQHVIPLEFGRKWGTECPNTRLPLPTLRCGIQREADLIFNSNFSFQNVNKTDKEISLNVLPCIKYPVNKDNFNLFFIKKKYVVSIFFSYRRLNQLSFNQLRSLLGVGRAVGFVHNLLDNLVTL